ncbi:MAG: polysaccharide ABC transporter ATP-binding protein [Acidobacteriota bacterium]
MSETAIRVQRLGKHYRIGERRQYGALRDTVTNTVSTSFRRVAALLQGAAPPAMPPPSNSFWALRDVSFDVPHGGLVGIIGRNGAGKSTLLKILSRITEPTEGRVEIRGRIGSLLEVGTGFHPELTGRENTFLNGAILGMKRAEIVRKFDEIVAFAALESFIDTTVKHYSTGMYMRLAFAVAAHLDPDILVIDEVLAVGDAGFQKKCLRKMEDVAKQGRTILFVSHQMNQIRRLCDTCLWLDGGRLRQQGPTAEVTSAYEAGPGVDGPRPGDDERTAARFTEWQLVQPGTGNTNILDTMATVTLRLFLKVNRPIRYAHHGIALFGAERQLMWATATDGIHLDVGVHQLTYVLPTLPIRPGNYTWQVSLYEDGQLIDLWDCSPDLIVATIPRTHPRDAWAGCLNIPYEFESELVPVEAAVVAAGPA